MMRRLLALVLLALLAAAPALAAVDAALVGSGQTLTNTVTTSAGSVSAGDTIICSASYDPGTTISSATISGSGSDTLTLIANNTSGTTARLAVYRKENATGGGSVSCTFTFSGTAYPTAFMVKATGAASASYDSGSMVSSTDASSPYTITSNAFAQANNVVLAFVDQNGGSDGAYASSNFTVLGSASNPSANWTHAVAKLVVSSTSAVTPSFTRTGSSFGTSALIVFGLKEAAGSAPVLSSATPSGTIGTSTTATIGATTNQNTGTLYTVLSTTNNVATATGTQIKAGQNSTGASAAFSGNNTVSTTTPSVGISGLTAATLYYYAEVQNNTNGDSNVVSGSFTTAASASVILNPISGKGGPAAQPIAALLAPANDEHFEVPALAGLISR